jgi:hypothetical protein
MTTPITLFDLPAPIFPHDEPVDPRPSQLKTMHRDYGVRADQTCGGCVHCALRNGGSRNYHKCTLYGRYTAGPGTDWRRKWVACGGWLSREENPLPEGWVLLRNEAGRWQGWYGAMVSTGAYILREEAIEAAQETAKGTVR